MIGFLELIANIREINHEESFSLFQEGMAGTADAIIASGINAMVDSVASFGGKLRLQICQHFLIKLIIQT